MTKHDEIILSLTKEKLFKILPIDYIDLQSIRCQCDMWRINDEQRNNVHQKDINQCRKEVSCEQTPCTGCDSCLFMQKKLEFVLAKGEHQFRTHKGFIDLLVQVMPKQFGCIYSKRFILKEYVIEVKTEKDFEDMGSILRQVNAYKDLYRVSCSGWWTESNKEFQSRGYLKTPKIDTVFCVLSTKIPEHIKEIFTEQDILCIELDKK